MKIAPLSWAAFGFMAVTLLAAAFAKVDFHSIPSILGAVGVAAAALASLCMHPPWAPMQPPAASNSANDAVAPPHAP